MLRSPYLFKRLVRRPVSALLLVCAVAVGTGVPAALMSATQTFAALIAPYPNGSRLVRLIRHAPSTTRFFSIAEFARLRDQVHGIDLAAFSQMRLVVETRWTTNDMRILRGSATLLRVLGMSASAGRVPSDQGTKQAMVSERIWRELGHQHFEQGHLVAIDTEAHEIVGLLPSGLRRPFDAEVWLPLPAPDGGPGNGRFLTVIAAVPDRRSGDSLAHLLAAATNGEKWAAMDLRQDLMGRTAEVLPLLAIISVLTAAGITMGVSFTAVIRLWWHQRAIGILSSLGANARAAVQWGLDELVVSTALGVMAAVWVSRSVHTIVLVLLGESPNIGHTQTSLPWLIGIGGLCVITSGCIVTAVTVTHARFQPISSAGAHRRRVPFLFVARAGIVAVSTTAVVVAVYGTDTARAISRLELGFDPEAVVYQRIRLLSDVGAPPDSTAGLVEEAFVSAGFREVAIASSAPLLDPAARTLIESDDKEAEVRATVRLVSPSFFSVMRIPFAAGHTIEPSGLTAVVSQKAASVLWPDGHYSDRVLRLGPARFRVTGVVRDVVDDPLSTGTDPIVYLSFAFGLPNSLVVIGRNSRSTSLESLKRVALPSAILAGENGSLQSVVDTWLRPHRLMMQLVSVVGLCAATLVALVMYLTALLLAELDRFEFTVKVALGASSLMLMREIAGRLTLSFAVGILGAAGLSGSAVLVALGPLDGRWFAAFLVAGTLTLLATAVGLTGAFPNIRKQPNLARALFEVTH